MALKLQDKMVIVEEVSQVAQTAHSLIGAHYRGLTVEQMTALRVRGRDADVYVRVVRNTLAQRAVSGTPYECVSEALVGPMVLAFSKKEPGAAARLIRDFAKEHNKLEVKVVSIGGKLLAANEIEILANLPTYEVAVARLLATMKAPIGKLVRTIAEPTAKLARTLAAVRDKKQSAE